MPVLAVLAVMASATGDACLGCIGRNGVGLHLGDAGLRRVGNNGIRLCNGDTGLGGIRHNGIRLCSGDTHLHRIGCNRTIWAWVMAGPVKSSLASLSHPANAGLFAIFASKAAWEEIASL